MHVLEAMEPWEGKRLVWQCCCTVNRGAGARHHHVTKTFIRSATYHEVPLTESGGLMCVRVWELGGATRVEHERNSNDNHEPSTTLKQ